MTFPELSETVSNLTERYSTRWVAHAAGVTPNMIRKVARGESGLDLSRVARLSHVLIEKKGDRSLASLFDTSNGDTVPIAVNGSLDDECLDMDAATVEARRAFERKDRIGAVRRLVAVRLIERRMSAEVARMKR